MLKNACLLANIGADKAENELNFAEILLIGPWVRPAFRARRGPPGAPLKAMAGIRAIVELGASFGVGVGAAGGAGYYLQQELRRRRDESIAALRPAAPAKAPAFDYDALYAAPPRREGPVYAFLRDGWNGALDGARKAIGDIFAP